MSLQNRLIELEPFQKRYFFQEFNDLSGKIYISLQLDTKIALSVNEFKQKVILRILDKEPLLRARIYYNETIEPSCIIHDVDEFTEEILNGLVEVSDLKIDSKEFFNKITNKPFDSNSDLSTMNKPNWKFVINFEENYVSFVYSHVLFDGMSGVHVLNSVLSFLNDQNYTTSDCKLQDHAKGEILYVYPKNKELAPFPPVLESPDKDVPLFGVSGIKVDPWAAKVDCQFLKVEDQSIVKRIIRKCKQNNVSLNSYMIASFAISMFTQEEIKCKFMMAIDLRGRALCNNKLIPKAALGLMITFTQIETPKITKSIATNGSYEQWEFIKKIHKLIESGIAESLSDLRSFGNFAVTSQKQFWEEQIQKIKSEEDQIPTYSFGMSNLSLNFKFNQENRYNVIRSVFSQRKRAYDYFSCSMISNSCCLDLTSAHFDDANKILEASFQRFRENILEN